MQDKPRQAPKTRPVELEQAEEKVIHQLRTLTDYGWGNLIIEVRNNGEIVMIRKETHMLTAQQRRRD